MLEEIGTSDRAADYLDEARASKRKVMGFGHREYRVKDPRAVILQSLAEEMFARFGHDEMYDVARALEEAAETRLGPKGIYPNVDFYSDSCIGSWESQGICSRRSSRLPVWLAGWLTGGSSLGPIESSGLRRSTPAVDCVNGRLQTTAFQPPALGYVHQTSAHGDLLRHQRTGTGRSRPRS